MKHPIIINSSDGSISSRETSRHQKMMALAQAMTMSLRTTRDYQSIGRKTFIVDQLSVPIIL